MPTVVVSSTMQYLNPAAPVGFEIRFAVYDTTAGGAGSTFVSTIDIDPVNAIYWTLDAANSTGKWDTVAGNYIRDAADPYDPDGITATWSERISNNAAAPTVYVLRARFNAPSGMIVVQSHSVQADDYANTGSAQVTVPIPAPYGWP